MFWGPLVEHAGLGDIRAPEQACLIGVEDLIVADMVDEFAGRKDPDLHMVDIQERFPPGWGWAVFHNCAEVGLGHIAMYPDSVGNPPEVDHNLKVVEGIVDIGCFAFEDPL